MNVQVYKKATISARVIRADGKVEDLGIISKISFQKSFLKKIIYFISKWIKL